MKADRTTKALLAIIALFLGIIALKPGANQTPAYGAAAAGGDKLSHIEVGAGATYMSVFNTRTGQVKCYGLGPNGFENRPMAVANVDEQGNLFPVR